nr:reverse transcriptase domain-containing protein [Tanacetum cinerariifolium]
MTENYVQKVEKLPGNSAIFIGKRENNVSCGQSHGPTYQGPTIPATSSFLPPVVKHETEATKDTMHPTNKGRTKDVQPLVVQTESPILNSEPVVAPIIEPVVAPIIMANVPLNDPNVDALAIVPAPVNPDHAPAQPVGLGDGFAPHWIGNNIHNNQNGWIEEDADEEEEDPEEDPKEDPYEEPQDDDDDMEMDDEAESEGSFPLPLSSQVREPPVDPSARPVPAPYPDDPYVVTRDATIADAAIATFGIDDDDDTAPMDTQPHEPRGSPRDTQ